MNKPVDLEFDIVIIGGGVSGFTSAYTITEKDSGLNVLILEETDRIGGKNLGDSRTVEFISSSNQYLKHILKKLRLTPLKRNVNGKAIGELTPRKITYSSAEIPIFGSLVQRKKFEYFLAKVEILCEKVSFLSPMGLLESGDLDKISMDEYICENLSSETSRNYLRSVIQTNCGVQAKDMSALFYIVYCSSTGGITNQLSRSLNGSTGYFMENASEEICKAMLEDEKFTVALNERVVGIWRDYSMISVITDKKRYKCLHVVVAISPDKVLLLDIRPPLTDRRRHVLNEMSYNLIETTVITHPVPKDLSGDIICGLEEDNAIQRSLDIHCLNPDSLFVFLYCNDTEKIVKQLNRYFGDGETVIHNGDYENYHNYKIFGVPSPCIMNDFHEIRRPLYRLFWAGTHTSTTWYGHLEGSVYAGIRAGIELLYDYKPQVLSRHDIIFLTNRSSPVSAYKDRRINKFIRHRRYYFKLLLVTVIGVFIYKKFRKYF